MTYLAKQLLIKLLLIRWDATTDPPRSLLKKWLDEILDEGELLDGKQAVITRVTAEEKNRVIDLVKYRIKADSNKEE